MTATPEAAARFLQRSGFVWHQRFELAPGVWTPGVSPVDWLCDAAGVPADLTGLTVLDVGTTNAGTAFELERRGAARVVAVDIYPPQHFGVDALVAFLGSKVQFIQSTVYELSARFAERFDLVVFWGVLYHLRHPLLALDNLREVTAGRLSLETAVCDAELAPEQRDDLLVRFYPRGELAGDATNWFAPTTATLVSWCASAGFEVELRRTWPAEAPERAMVNLRPTAGLPEWRELSYELPLRCSTA